MEAPPRIPPVLRYTTLTPTARMLTREQVKQLCDTLCKGITLRKTAIYPPNDKRRLPSDIATPKDFVQMRATVLEIQMGLKAMHDNIYTRARPPNPIYIIPKAAAFLRLTPEFGGVYTRDLMMKAVGLYVVVNELTDHKGFRMDERLALAMEKEVDDVVPHNSLFGWSAKMVDKAKTKAKKDKHISSDIEALLKKEYEVFERISAVVVELKYARKQVQACVSSSNIGILQVEKNKWLEVVAQRLAKLKGVASGSRVLIDREDEPEPDESDYAYLAEEEEENVAVEEEREGKENIEGGENEGEEDGEVDKDVGGENGESVNLDEVGEEP